MKLTKQDVEALLDRYDSDPIDALTIALRRVLAKPGTTWSELIEAGPFAAAERQALIGHQQAALDALAAELNELRTLEPRSASLGTGPSTLRSGAPSGFGGGSP